MNEALAQFLPDDEMDDVSSAYMEARDIGMGSVNRQIANMNHDARYPCSGDPIYNLTGSTLLVQRAVLDEEQRHGHGSTRIRLNGLPRASVLYGGSNARQIAIRNEFPPTHVNGPFFEIASLDTNNGAPTVPLYAAVNNTMYQGFKTYQWGAGSIFIMTPVQFSMLASVFFYHGNDNGWTAAYIASPGDGISTRPVLVWSGHTFARQRMIALRDSGSLPEDEADQRLIYAAICEHSTADFDIEDDTDEDMFHTDTRETKHRRESVLYKRSASD